jgi:6-pyruvoyltetrahydropterin/6-carboxytetrahydropterin synthase
VPEAFRIAVSKDYLVFSSAHFITMKGHHCEALHGHNYRVGVAVEGPLDAESLFVIDFSVIKQIARRLVDAIDHRVLLPTGNPKIAVHEDGDRVSVDVFGEPRYFFPRRDCAILPIGNSTAEKLAEYLALQLRDELDGLGVSHLSRLEVEVEESPGQTATFRLTPTAR